MNRSEAKKIAKAITNIQLQDMLNKAKENIKDWTDVSKVNIGMTKGTAWNILAYNFDPSQDYHILYKTNMIREYGEFLPDNMKLKKKKRSIEHLIHQEPKFR